MPVIVIASSKGGAGKSTTAILLGTELAQAGANITLLDCDPNKSLSLWAAKGKLPDRIEVFSGIEEADIVKFIQKHDNDGRIVIVDPEGVASRLLSRAISQADLVIIPMRATVLDATIGARSLQLIAEEQEAYGRHIPSAVVFTMTRAVRSKQQNGIETSLRDQGVDVIEPGLIERSAFSAIFEYGGDLRSAPPQGNIQGALTNAQEFAQAVYSRLSKVLANG